MAARKNDVPTPEAAPIDLGLGAEDVQLPRLSVIGKLSKLPDTLRDVRPGNIAIGMDAEDADSQVFDAMNGKEPVRLYVLNIHANYACSFKDKEANPDLAGIWEEGDMDMPPEAKRQFNYTLFVPSHSTILPVKYTASSTAAKEARKVNSKLQTEALGGRMPFETCFDMTTVMRSGGSFTWPGPAFALGKADAAEVTQAQQMYEMLYGPVRQQLAATSGDAKPSL